MAVTAPVFLVDELPDGGSFVLGGAEGHHAATVRRLRVGEAVRLADGDGGVADCVVAAVEPGALTLTVVGRGVVEAARPRFVLVQALAKGDRQELAVELATEVGVDEVVPWAAARSVVRWQGERADRALARWRATAREAAKQSRRTFVPDVAELHSTRQVCALIARVTADRGAALVLDATASTPLAATALPPSGDVLLVVGPEGGISEGELTAFRASGARAVRLGGTILRTSTAGAAAMAVLSVRAGRWA